MKNPTRNRLIEYLASVTGLSTAQASAVVAAIGATPAADATGTLFGDVVGALLGPLLVQGIHGDELTKVLAVDLDDWDPNADSLLLRMDLAGFAWGGLAAPDTMGEVRLVLAVTAGTISHEGAGSTDVNRFACADATDVTMAAGGMALIIYDGTAQRWDVFAGGSGGGSGTGTPGAQGDRGWDGDDGRDGEWGPPGPVGPDGRIAYQDHSNTGATETIDWSRDVHRLLLDAAAVTLSVANVPASGTPAIVRLLLIQDVTGSRTVVWWSGITWVGGSAPTLASAPGAITSIDLMTVDGGASYLGMVASSAGGGSSSSSSTAAAMPLPDPYPDAHTRSLVEEVADSIMLGRGQGLQVEDAAGNHFGQVQHLLVDRATAAPSGDTVQLRGLAAGTIGCKAYNSTTQLLSNATTTALTLDTEEFDTDGFHSTAAATSKMTVPAGLAGKYLVVATVGYAANATGERQTWLAKNGSGGNIRGGTISTGSYAADVLQQTVTAIVELAAGDYVEVYGWQSSTGNLNVGSASVEGYRTTLALYKLDSGRMGSGIGCKATKSGNQAVSASTATTPITFDGESFDTDAFHDNAANTSRMTIPAGMGGKYLMVGYVYVSGIAANTNFVHARVYKNGATTLGGDRRARSPDDNTILTISAIADLVAGDYVELTAESDDGTYSINGSGCFFEIMRLDSLPLSGYAEGTAFPTGPTTNQKFYRTDLNLLFYYDGTRWLTTQLFHSAMAVADSGLPFTVTAAFGRLSTKDTTGLDMWLVSFETTTFITGASSGVNYWTVDLSKFTAGNVGTSVASWNSQADAANTWVARQAAIGAALAVGTHLQTQVTCTKTGAAASIYIGAALSYRLIGV